MQEIQFTRHLLLFFLNILASLSRSDAQVEAAAGRDGIYSGSPGHLPGKQHAVTQRKKTALPICDDERANASAAGCLT